VEFHPVSNLFPMMNPDEFKALVDDIRQNGQREDVWLHEGQIIDGRNRYKACTELGITPRTRTWHGDGSLVQFVVSLNLHRRHLSASQKAMVAVEILPMLEIEAKKRQGARTDLTSVNSLTDVREPQRASEIAAEIVGTNRQYVSDAKRIAEQAPELKPLVLSGELNIPEAKVIAALPPEERAEAINKPHVANNGGDNEWYTPREYIEAARLTMGSIDTDPASSETANAVVKATVFFSAQDDGLSKTWPGNVWMNPPYAQPLITQFCDKLVAEVESGQTNQAIILVNNATETGWFQRLASVSAAICFPKGRIRFWAPDKLSAPLQGQAVLYIGKNPDTFKAHFGGFGFVVMA
jgi:phage N-6-adenine-methyltransferase